MLISVAELRSLCIQAAQNSGADVLTAEILASAIVRAESNGKTAVGLTHFFDYLQALKSGAIQGNADPEIHTRGIITRANAHRNIPHRAFQQAQSQLIENVQTQGVGVLAISNAFTAGELGFFTAALAKQGCIGLAVANSPALVAIGAAQCSVLGTNPLSFAVPLQERPLVIDQSIAHTAFVSIRQFANQGKPLPEGWAIDAQGHPTIDAFQALNGSLLPGDHHKLANIGMMVETLAGLAGGLWSLDSPSFDSGDQSPSIGVFIIAINLEFFDQDFPQRINAHFTTLEEVYGVYLPGRSHPSMDTIAVDRELYAKLMKETRS